MKVTLDGKRFAHLAVLLGLSYGFAQIFIRKFGMTTLSAFGISCSLCCQVSNILMKYYVDGGDSIITIQQNKKTTGTRKNGNPKKNKHK